MTKEILVAIWNQAPFQSSILRGIDELNSHLKSKDILVSYEPVLVKSKNPTKADVFILDGGEDINPERYGQKNQYSYFSDARDKAEFSLTKFYSNTGARLSGVCRGHQLLNVYFDGTLYQDIRQCGLVKSGDSHTSGHKVFIPTKNKRRIILPSFTGEASFTVSSLHHQSVQNFGRGIFASLVWRPAKKSSSNYYTGTLVEGIESSEGKIRGLQSHPEFRGYPKDGLLFAYLMHVDAFTKEFITIDAKRVEKKFGKRSSSKYYPTDSSPSFNDERVPAPARLRRNDDIDDVFIGRD